MDTLILADRPARFVAYLAQYACTLRAILDHALAARSKTTRLSHTGKRCLTVRLLWVGNVSVQAHHHDDYYGPRRKEATMSHAGDAIDNKMTRVQRYYHPIQKDYATFLQTSEETSGEYTLIEVEVAPGGGTNPTTTRPTTSTSRCWRERWRFWWAKRPTPCTPARRR